MPISDTTGGKCRSLWETRWGTSLSARQSHSQYIHGMMDGEAMGYFNQGTEEGDNEEEKEKKNGTSGTNAAVGEADREQGEKGRFQL